MCPYGFILNREDRFTKNKIDQRANVSQRKLEKHLQTFFFLLKAVQQTRVPTPLFYDKCGNNSFLTEVFACQNCSFITVVF